MSGGHRALDRLARPRCSYASEHGAWFADRIAATVTTVRGAGEVKVEQDSGTPQHDLEIDREAAARHGIRVATVAAVRLGRGGVHRAARDRGAEWGRAGRVIFRQLRERGDSAIEVVEQGCTLRFRPLLMTVLTSFIGDLPMLYATGSGADLQKPLAVVVMGVPSPPRC